MSVKIEYNHRMANQNTSSNANRNVSIIVKWLNGIHRSNTSVLNFSVFGNFDVNSAIGILCCFLR